MLNREFEITPVQGRWVLTLLEDGEELGGGVFAGTDEGYLGALDVACRWCEGVK